MKKQDSSYTEVAEIKIEQIICKTNHVFKQARQ